jgi:L-threonylcarbamoyladenylate synthase
MPCDTIYGLVGSAPDTEARIRAIKGRGEDKPFLQLVADRSWVARVSPSEVPASLATHWPGPLTVILPALDGGTVAVRVPDSAFLRGILEAVGRPLLSTSVNRAGKPALWKIGEIVKEFESEVDLVIDGGDLPGVRPSTIVDATVVPYRVVRQGALELPGGKLS